MIRLLLATNNGHKVAEISAVMPDLPIRLATYEEFPSIPEPVEDGDTLEANAIKKAVHAATLSGLWALADDTGLEVDALNGAPGVITARYAGEGCSYADNNRLLLRNLQGVAPDKRKAVFRTVMALSSPDGRTTLEEGRLAGSIAETARGEQGFGYDPIFLLPQGKTLAELTMEEKGRLSHRAAALRNMRPHLARLAASALALVLLALAPARAAKTEAAPQTVYDQLMQSQSRKQMYLGSQYMEFQQYDKAVQEFSKAVIASPKDANAHIMLGAALYWSGNVPRAQDEFREALRLDPENAQGHLMMGIAYAWNQDNQAAYAEFKEAAKRAPERPDIQMDLGSMEETFGQTQDALEHFRKAAILDPKSPLYHYQLGTLYRRLERYEDAAESLRRALKEMSEFEDAMLELGAVYERMGKNSDAEDMFKRAVKLKPMDSVARLRLGRILVAGGRADKARDVYRDAFHLTPADASGGLALSVSFGGKPQAGSGPGPSPATPPPPDANDPLSVLGRNLDRIPLDQDAELSVNLAVLPRPKLVKSETAEGSSGLKRALEKAGKPAEGAMAVKRDFRLNASKPEQRREQIKKIMEDLRSVLAKAPPDAEVRMGMNLNFVKPAMPVPDSTTPASEQPKATYQPRKVGNDLKLWVVGTGWTVLVQEVLPETGAAPAHPDLAEWWLTDGLAYAALGESKAALDAFNRALAREPKDEIGLLGRAVAFVEMGREEEAMEAYRQVLKHHPKNKSAKDGLAWLMRGPVGVRHDQPSGAGPASPPGPASK
ncbi:MAG: RdgB/HAM1 family non-canonical purine NTP pyrophosphatase [Elusimicrobia bacterium]|nr:RdgB/HAM1 family non-canonical purine NTP pyrophosphatase [Elusimicrobiota bacterium]